MIAMLFLFLISVFTISHGTMNADHAGIVPYCKENGKIHLLLGKDAYRTNDGLSDFGGSKDEEENFKYGASREGHEETMGVFSETHTDPANDENVQKGIKFFKDKINDNYVAQITFHNSRKKTRATYETFFVDVTQEVEDLGGKDEVISLLNKTLKILKINYTDEKREMYLEKIYFAWIPLDTLWQAFQKASQAIQEAAKSLKLKKMQKIEQELKDTSTLNTQLSKLEELFVEHENAHGHTFKYCPHLKLTCQEKLSSTLFQNLYVSEQSGCKPLTKLHAQEQKLQERTSGRRW